MCFLNKELSSGTETSSIPPFEQRPCDASGLYKGFDPKLREAMKPTHDYKGNRSERNCHRFWIQADEMTYNITEDENKVCYLFGNVNMSVRCKSQILSREGKNKDSIGEEDEKSPEIQFAEQFTNNYDKLAYEHFPEFLRLKELCKLQYVGRFLQQHLQHLRQSIPDELDPEQLRTVENAVKTNINEMLVDIKRQIGSDKSNPAYVNQCREILHKKQTELFNQRLVSDADIKNWLSGSRRSNEVLVDKIMPEESAFKLFVESTIICKQREASRVRKVAFEENWSRLVESAQLMRVNCQPSSEEPIEWVPAVFRRIDGSNSFVYGGVDMQPKLVKNPRLTVTTNRPNGSIVQIPSNRLFNPTSSSRLNVTTSRTAKNPAAPLSNNPIISPRPSNTIRNRNIPDFIAKNSLASCLKFKAMHNGVVQCCPLTYEFALDALRNRGVADANLHKEALKVNIDQLRQWQMAAGAFQVWIFLFFVVKIFKLRILYWAKIIINIFLCKHWSFLMKISKGYVFKCVESEYEKIFWKNSKLSPILLNIKSIKFHPNRLNIKSRFG
jgi:hypothetical protein